MRNLNQLHADELEEFTSFQATAPVTVSLDIIFRYWRFGLPAMKTWEDISRSEIVIFPHNSDE